MQHRDSRGRRGVIAVLCVAVALACGGCGGDDGTSPKPTPTPTWSNADIVWTAPYATGGSYPSTLSYLKSGTTVMLQGMANAGATKVQEGQVICTLPDGFRPPSTETAIVLCPTWGWPGGGADGTVGSAGIVILPDGQVIVRTVQQYDGQMQFLMLDGISFSTVTGTDGWTNSGIVWTAPYAADGAYPSTLEYRKVGAMVELRGFANAGGTHVSSGDVIGILPAGYRPPAGNTAILLGPTWGWPAAEPAGYVGIAGIMVQADGSIQVHTVQHHDGEQQFLNFDGLAFSTAAASDGWTDSGLSFVAPYSAAAPYPSELEFTKMGDTVVLRAFANAGNTRVQSGQDVGVLPAGYRAPTDDAVFMLCPTWGWPGGFPDGYVGTAGVYILNNGTIHVQTVPAFDGEMQFLNFEGKRFSTSWRVPE